MKVALVGTGNMAHNLGRALVESKVHLIGVCARDVHKRSSLATSLACDELDWADLVSADVVVLAVSDDAISEVSTLVPQGPIVVHTSGAVAMTAIQHDRAGVLYPLQTMTTDQKVDWQSVPICVEGDTIVLEPLASLLSDVVHVIDSETRKKVHLAAVLVNNFSNHLYTLASDWLEEQKVDFSILHPLLLETARKAVASDPASVQTGPARRGDVKVINQHLALLDNNSLTDIYRLMTDSILSHGKEL